MRTSTLDEKGIIRYIQGNYPIKENAEVVDIDDKNNYFTKKRPKPFLPYINQTLYDKNHNICICVI
jgi:hypothetical protein